MAFYFLFATSISRYNLVLLEVSDCLNIQEAVTRFLKCFLFFNAVPSSIYLLKGERKPKLMKTKISNTGTCRARSSPLDESPVIEFPVTPPVGVPAFAVSVVVMMSVMLCAWLLPRSKMQAIN